MWIKNLDKYCIFRGTKVGFQREKVPGVVNGFGGVLDLEDAAIRRKCGDGEIVTCSNAAHLSSFGLSVVESSTEKATNRETLAFLSRNK